eukprot:TRINITY_DN12204_c0_g2_i1.p1 TRINITY_DN12204_c0_g2~~TRINITY_DN12204_c0_g2_i1.p1  ORF type:complete len:354 (+),score=60.14 TRINITY_DN12204_c0_g2_i1:425-1486(+)
MWPRFTILGQSIGSMVLGFEALFKECPDVYLDTMGYAFTFPIFSIFCGAVVGCYVHYPTISEDMIKKVSVKDSDFNNDSSISQSNLKTSLKLVYYRAFAIIYRFVGSFASLVMVNSTWTRNHIRSLWGCEPHLIYPPVDCASLQELPLSPREPTIVSIAQFRKEKNHMLQLESFSNFLEKNPVFRGRVKLVMIGSVRSHKKGDAKRVRLLQERAKELSLQDSVVLAVNISKSELKSYLSRATVGLHTMKDEHFGIGIVELMAAGVFPIAHNSAGPKEDIVRPFNGLPTGLLALNLEEFSGHLEYVFKNQKLIESFVENSRDYVRRFSDQSFSRSVLHALRTIPKLHVIFQKML